MRLDEVGMNVFLGVSGRQAVHACDVQGFGISVAKIRDEEFAFTSNRSNTISTSEMAPIKNVNE